MGSERGSVELVNVTKRYGDVVAVDSLNLEIKSGEFLSLLGPSGCGKTTTLRMLAGFEQPDEGFVRISGEYVQGVPPYKRDVNTVFQHYALFPHMTVHDNVAFGLQMRKVPGPALARQVSEALDLVHLGAFEQLFMRAGKMLRNVRKTLQIFLTLRQPDFCIYRSCLVVFQLAPQGLQGFQFVF